MAERTTRGRDEKKKRKHIACVEGEAGAMASGCCVTSCVTPDFLQQCSNLSFTSNLNKPFGVRTLISRYDIIDQLFHNKLVSPHRKGLVLSKPHYYCPYLDYYYYFPLP